MHSPQHSPAPMSLSSSVMARGIRGALAPLSQGIACRIEQCARDDRINHLEESDAQPACRAIHQDHPCCREAAGEGEMMYRSRRRTMIMQPIPGIIYPRLLQMLTTLLAQMRSADRVRKRLLFGGRPDILRTSRNRRV